MHKSHSTHSMEWIGPFLVEKMQMDEQIDRGGRKRRWWLWRWLWLARKGPTRGLHPIRRTWKYQISQLMTRQLWDAVSPGRNCPRKETKCVYTRKQRDPTVQTMFYGFPIAILLSFLSFHHDKSHLHFLTSPFTTVRVFFESKSKLKIKC